MKLEVKNYCNSAKMRLEVNNPLVGLVPTGSTFINENVIIAVYLCDNRVEVSREILQRKGYSTFEYAYKGLGLFQQLVSSERNCT